MIENPYSPPYLCPHCKDVRQLAENYACRKSVPCPACGTLDEGAYLEFVRERMEKTARKPELQKYDFTPAMWDEFTQLRVQYPRVSDVTILSWMEGNHYDPSKDGAFLSEVTARLAGTFQEEIEL